MRNWRAWMAMAQSSLHAAGKILEADPRSAASRYYYAAYQAMSALLLYADPTLNPPVEREAWSHADTPKLLAAHLVAVVPSLGRRNDMQERLQRLYKIRLSADYSSADSINDKLSLVRKDAEFLMKIAEGITGVAKVKR